MSVQIDSGAPVQKEFQARAASVMLPGESIQELTHASVIDTAVVCHDNYYPARQAVARISVAYKANIHMTCGQYDDHITTHWLLTIVSDLLNPIFNS